VLVRLAAVLSIVVAVMIATRLIFVLVGPASAKLRRRKLARGYLGGVPGVGWTGTRGGVSLAAALAVP
ncbi:MAG: hypothetical protein WBD70_17615, partial [Mycobacterium sp.]